MSEVVWISHRGYKKNATENTREAFQAAIKNGFQHCETDLRTTADGHIILSHDIHLLRVAQNPMNVEEATRKELEKVVLPFNNRLYFLDHLLSEFQNYDWSFDIKLSTTKTDKTIAAFIQLIQARNCVDWVNHHVRFCLWHPQHEVILKRTFSKTVFYARKIECQRAGISILAHVPFLGGIKEGRIYSLYPEAFGRALFVPEMASPYLSRNAHLLAFLPKTETQTQQALTAGFDNILTDGIPIIR